MANAPSQGMTQTEWLAYITSWARSKQRKAQHTGDKKQVMRWKGIVATCMRDERRWADRNQLILGIGRDR